MARSGSQSLGATQLGFRLIVRIRISGSLYALTWSTRETPDFAGIQSSARPKAAAFGDRGLACHMALILAMT